jgi:hypothetical protein
MSDSNDPLLGCRDITTDLGHTQSVAKGSPKSNPSSVVGTSVSSNKNGPTCKATDTVGTKTPSHGFVSKSAMIPSMKDIPQVTIQEDELLMLYPVKSHKYKPIGVHEQIRILRLFHAARKTDPIQCTLITRPFSSSSQQPPAFEYEALLYHIGEEEATNEIIIYEYNDNEGEPTPQQATFDNVDRRRFLIRRNLETALLQLRSDIQDIDIWVAELCINKNDVGLETALFLRRKDIYTQAKRVHVWLGKGRKDNRQIFDFLKEILIRRELECVTENEKKALKEWPLVVELLSNTWFTSPGVIRELESAKDRVMRWGTEEIAWENFWDAIALCITTYGKSTVKRLNIPSKYLDLEVLRQIRGSKKEPAEKALAAKSPIPPSMNKENTPVVQGSSWINRVRISSENRPESMPTTTSMPGSTETASSGLGNASTRDDPVVGVTQNNDKTMVNETIGVTDANSQVDRSDHNPPQDNRIGSSSITDLKNTGILSAKGTPNAQSYVVDENAAVVAFITMLSEQEVVGHLLKKVGYPIGIASHGYQLRRELMNYMGQLVLDAKGPLEQAATQFLRDHRLEVIYLHGVYLKPSRRNEVVNIKTYLQQFSDFLIGTAVFKSSYEGDKTEDPGLSNAQRVKKFLFDGPACRNLETGITRLLEPNEVSHGVSKLRISSSSNLKSSYGTIPKAKATNEFHVGKNTSAAAERAFSTMPKTKPSALINQAGKTEGSTRLKTAISLKYQQAHLVESDAESTDVVSQEITIGETETLITEMSTEVKDASLVEPDSKRTEMVNQENRAEEVAGLKALPAEEQEASVSQIEDLGVPGAFPFDDAFLHTDEFTEKILNETPSKISPMLLSNMRDFFQQAYRQVIKSFRPALQEGFRRIEWHCVGHKISLNTM